jgi:hypothetical protein
VEGKTVFISSLSRRELARRRSQRSARPPAGLQLLFAVAVVAAAVMALLIVRGVV